MLKIREKDYFQIRIHGEAAYPNECCGVLMGTSDGELRIVSSVNRATNGRTDSPGNRYSIEPKELVRIQREGLKRGEDIIGFYHSHPDHPALCSRIDLAEAHWFGCSYVITSVEKGQAAVTNSFELRGEEEDKRLEPETIELC